jgi:hypothetical protein
MLLAALLEVLLNRVRGYFDAVPSISRELVTRQMLP